MTSVGLKGDVGGIVRLGVFSACGWHRAACIRAAINTIRATWARITRGSFTVSRNAGKTLALAICSTLREQTADVPATTEDWMEQPGAVGKTGSKDAADHFKTFTLAG